MPRTCVGWPGGLAGFLTSARREAISGLQAWPVFDWRIGCCNEDSASLGLRLLGLGNQKVKTLCGRASKFDLDQSERKSSQNNARARNAGPNKSQGDLSFQIASTYPENSTLRWNRSSKFLLPRLVSRHCLLVWGISLLNYFFLTFLQNKAWIFWCSWVSWQTCSFLVQLEWRDPMLEVKLLMSEYI